MNGVLADASFLIALLDRDDAGHPGARAELESLRAPLCSAWPPIAEAMHYFADLPLAREALCDMIEDGVLAVLPLARDDASRMKVLMRQYRDLPMDFADAALVRVAERDGLKTILSFDKHFRLYRLPRRGSFEVLP